MSTAHLKGGPLSRRAAVMCAHANFRLYLDQAKRYRYRIESHALPDGTHDENDAAEFIRTACGVTSRAELDHDREAAMMFERIVDDYRAWQRRQAAMARGA
ncbi:hypothetical protein C7446_2328 [Kushneria sinocarnis]|uniref:Uncharacterized protein n=1 Tax=Kushneria sinocarnis TaxID=595502 RepID=A0A420WVL9_9GAMM|nr:hypothetical protein [Kushneria sinocarnis]RKR02610.1 hypothetical protein C7446_2328 [Kushneria sinocarnis]